MAPFRLSRISVALLLLLAPAGIVLAADSGLDVLGSHYRPDTPFPEFVRFWHEGWNLAADPEMEAIYRHNALALGGSLHLLVRSAGHRPLTIEDVRLEDFSLTECIAFSDQRQKRKPASIFFADLSADQRARLIAAGEPVWWRVNPNPMPPGGTAEVIVRLRRKPERHTLRLGLVTGQGDATVTLSITGGRCQLTGISFAPDLRRAWLYFQEPKDSGQTLTGIRLDGRDVSRSAVIGRDAAVHRAVAEVRLQKPLARGSFHCFQGVYDDGTTVSGAAGAWADELAYGIWGGRPGKSGDTPLATAYVKDITSHNINVQMPQLGSAAVQSFFKSAAGKRLCRTLGLRKIISDPGKYGTTDPLAYFIHDEPDCGDYLIQGLDGNHKVGSLAQWAVQRSGRLRAEDAGTPLLLNVDMTFKPHNWYTYGQLPDIFACDPYYQERLRDAYWRHPQRLAIYANATYIDAVVSVAWSACAPRPLHVILNAVRHTDKKSKRRFRFATPAEKRIEVYYAIGAGAKGISYWWYTPAGNFFGVGAADSDPEAARLWREIGLLGAELRTAGPLITRSCPVQLAVQTRRELRLRTLAAGLDTLLLVAVNEQYANDRLGTVVQPLGETSVTVRPPAWLKPSQVFEITPAGTQDVTWKTKPEGVTVTFSEVPLTRLVVATSDTGLRQRLQRLYEDKLAANVAALRQAESHGQESR